jgi:hypothetical protein
VISKPLLTNLKVLQEQQTQAKTSTLPPRLQTKSFPLSAAYISVHVAHSSESQIGFPLISRSISRVIK